ncbi:hypothetical protein L1N85_16505 [Paenibacillus alkaliterrae]|uniref:hypothetical protein n=1 Tax=Paenibacillus alkaliterrae TaxID=320909 RepID=UPI001F266D2E|nr:hypothetical protein [Paenibacillus alkaliterrae]MCF2940011.1 hypothetical protein [Paenibacillus alkaliterrae]
MHGILLEFTTSKTEETRTMAYAVRSQYEVVPGFINITFFNDVESGGDTHGFLLQLESAEVADQFLQQIKHADLSALEVSNFVVRKFKLLE